MARGKLTKQEVLTIIRDKILFLELKPGEAILDTDLAEKLEVSRTPVREALLFLKQEQLVDIYPQSGTFVSLIDLDLIREIVYIRHILECEVFLSLIDKKAEVKPQIEKYLLLQELAVKANNQKEYVKNDHLFHQELFSLAGHGRSWELLQSHYIHTTRFHMLDFYNSKTVFEASLEEHKEIVDCFDRGDKKELKRILTVHHDCKLRTADTLKKQYPDYFI